MAKEASAGMAGAYQPKVMMKKQRIRQPIEQGNIEAYPNRAPISSSKKTSPAPTRGTGTATAPAPRVGGGKKTQPVQAPRPSGGKNFGMAGDSASAGRSKRG